MGTRQEVTVAGFIAAAWHIIAIHAVHLMLDAWHKGAHQPDQICRICQARPRASRSAGRNDLTLTVNLTLTVILTLTEP